jgi:hypothetical protein
LSLRSLLRKAASLIATMTGNSMATSQSEYLIRLLGASASESTRPTRILQAIPPFARADLLSRHAHAHRFLVRGMH